MLDYIDKNYSMRNTCMCGAMKPVSLLFDQPTYVSRYEKAGFFGICENKDADQRLFFRYTDSTIPLLPKPEISILQPSSVGLQPGLRRTWSETPKTGFLTTRLIYYSR